MSKFQLIFLGILIVAVIAAVGVFALNKASSGVTANVVIWGTLPDTSVKALLQRSDVTSALESKKVAVTYVTKPENTFDQSVVEAIATGKGPDAVLISQDAALQYLDKVAQIPYSSFSQRSFKDTYVQEAELFLTSQGIEALPFAIDPMVMYWNRTLFANAGIANPPTLWSQLYVQDGVISKINKIDENHNILKTALALGTYNNVFHAKDIMSLLMFQAGSSIVSKNNNGNLMSGLNMVSSASSQNGAVASLNFYTQFADPAKSLYSWNTAMPLSRDNFTSGDLALYFGYASELNDLYTRNPNLNFDVASVPQGQNSSVNTTFGKVYGLAILKSSLNVAASANAIITLTNSTSQSAWSDISGYPPVTKDLLSQTPSSPFMTVFYTAALQSKGWLDPNRTVTDGIFGDMVNNVLSGSKLPEDTVQDANNRLTQLFNTFSN